MIDSIRLLDLGPVPPLRSQALYHGLAESMDANAPDTIVLCRPAAPYFCAGYHQPPEAELDLAWCRENGYPVIQRRIGGGTVFLHPGQLFYQCVFHRSRVPFDVASIYRRFLAPPVEALRRLGLDARLSGVNEIEVGIRRIAGTGGGQIGEAVVVVGNILFDFPYAVMIRAWRVPSPPFRRLAAAGLRRHLATLSGELGSAPNMGEVGRLLAEAYGDGLGRPLVSGELSARESIAIARAAARLGTGERYQGGPSCGGKLKITGRVAVHEWTWPTPTGEVRVTTRVADGEIEELIMSGAGGMDREEVEERIQHTLVSDKSP